MVCRVGSSGGSFAYHPFPFASLLVLIDIRGATFSVSQIVAIISEEGGVDSHASVPSSLIG